MYRIKSKEISEKDNTYKEYYGYVINRTGSSALTGGSGTAWVSEVLKLDSDNDFELHKMAFVATSGNVLMKIRDTVGKYINPLAVDMRAIAGTSVASANGITFNPFVLPTPYRFARASNMIVELAEASGSSNTVRLIMHGVKVRQGIAPWEKHKRRVGAIYTTERKSLSGNGSAQAVLKIDDDADFLVQKICAIRTGAATISINEVGRGLDWCNGSTHIDNICGNGQFPHILSAPRFLPHGSNITFNITDISGSANTVEIVLIGARLYA